MEREELRDMQRRIFGRIEIECKNDLTPAIFELGNDEFPYDVFSMIMYDLGQNGAQCRGEFGFIGMDTELGVQNFKGIITLGENIGTEHLDELCSAVNALNFYIPFGAFSFDNSGKELVFKHGGPITADIAEETLYDQVQLFMSGAFQMVDKYVDLLMDVAEGKKTAELIKEITGQEE